jgi:hypothetical protein
MAPRPSAGVARDLAEFARRQALRERLALKDGDKGGISFQIPEGWDDGSGKITGGYVDGDIQTRPTQVEYGNHITVLNTHGNIYYEPLWMSRVCVKSFFTTQK